MQKYLQELRKRKDLLMYLVVSGIKAEYRNTYLGYVWWILDPLLIGAVYYFLRVVVLGMEGDHIGAFLIIGLVVIAAFLAFYRLVPGIELLWLPVIMIIQFMFLSAIGLIIGYYAIFVRDIDNVLTHIKRFWFYGSPVIWEHGRLGPDYQFIVDMNPASTFFMGYRNIFMYQPPGS